MSELEYLIYRFRGGHAIVWENESVPQKLND